MLWREIVNSILSTTELWLRRITKADEKEAIRSQVENHNHHEGLMGGSRRRADRTATLQARRPCGSSRVGRLWTAWGARMALGDRTNGAFVGSA